VIAHRGCAIAQIWQHEVGRPRRGAPAAARATWSRAQEGRAAVTLGLSGRRPWRLHLDVDQGGQGQCPTCWASRLPACPRERL